VLANAKFDFVEVHWYGSPPNVALGDSALLASGVSYFAFALVQLQSELAAAGKANTPIYVGEWGLPGPNDGSPQDITIVGALYTALALSELIEGGVGMAGVREGFDSGPCVPSPPGDYSWQTWYTSSLFEAISAGMNPACPSIAQPPLGTAFPRANALQVVQQAFNAGDTVFAPAVSSSLATVKAYGRRRGSGYGLLLVNTDQNHTVTTAVGILNDAKTFTISSLVYGRAQYDNSQNNVWTTPVSQSLGRRHGSFSITLPPWSVTAITLSRRPLETIRVVHDSRVKRDYHLRPSGLTVSPPKRELAELIRRHRGVGYRCIAGPRWDCGRYVDLNRPILNWGRPFDKALKIR
jgi:hypothetical protein